MSKDRHRKGYYAEYNAKRVAQGKPKDRHRKGYYRNYNKAHPERLARIGINTDAVYDEEIPPITLSKDCYDDGELDMRCTDWGEGGFNI